MNAISNMNSPDLKHTKNLAAWTSLWLLSLALASFGPKLWWGENPAISAIAVVLNAGLGVCLIMANRRHLNSLDELQRKIQLEALALALGVAVVGGLSYSLLDVTNLIPYDAEISLLCILVSITYLLGIWIGQKRYA